MNTNTKKLIARRMANSASSADAPKIMQVLPDGTERHVGFAQLSRKGSLNITFLQVYTPPTSDSDWACGKHTYILTALELLDGTFRVDGLNDKRSFMISSLRGERWYKIGAVMLHEDGNYHDLLICKSPLSYNIWGYPHDDEQSMLRDLAALCDIEEARRIPQPSVISEHAPVLKDYHHDRTDDKTTFTQEHADILSKFNFNLQHVVKN